MKLLGQIEDSVSECIKTLGITKEKVLSLLKVGGILAVIYLAYRIWKMANEGEKA